MKFNDKLREICESEGWGIIEDDNYIDLRQYSPAGEDFGFTVSKANFVEEVVDYYESFDTEEHVAMWVNAKSSETSGIPSIARLVEDAEEIDSMLSSLACALQQRCEEDDE